MMPGIEAVGWGVGFGVIAAIVAGIRRMPWRYGIVVGVGTGLVLGTLRLAMQDAPTDAGLLVLIGALGASLATLGAERGERERERRTATILARRT